jgi:hypothetical protein
LRLGRRTDAFATGDLDGSILLWGTGHSALVSLWF